MESPSLKPAIPPRPVIPPRPAPPVLNRFADAINNNSVNSSSPSLGPVSGPPPARPKHESAPPPSKNGTETSNGGGKIPELFGRPRSASGAKRLLSLALLEAQSAVQLDNGGNIAAAIESYNKAVQLLGKVMEATPAPEERERLKMIVS